MWYLLVVSRRQPTPILYVSFLQANFVAFNDNESSGCHRWPEEKNFSVHNPAGLILIEYIGTRRKASVPHGNSRNKEWVIRTKPSVKISVFITKSNHKANRPFRFVTPATVTKHVRGVLAFTKLAMVNCVTSLRQSGKLLI
jgi:hypothetical protein